MRRPTPRAHARVRPRTRRAAVAAVVLAAPLLATGCGADGGAPDPDAAPAPAASGAPTTSSDGPDDGGASATATPSDAVPAATGVEVRARNPVFPEWRVAARVPAGWRIADDPTLRALGTRTAEPPAGEPRQSLSLYAPSSYSGATTPKALARYVADINDAAATPVEPLDVAGTEVVVVDLDFSAVGGNAGRSRVAVYVVDDTVVLLDSTAIDETVSEQEQRDLLTSVLLTASPGPAS